MTISGITEKRWPSYLILLLAALLVLLGYVVRSESILSAAAAFAAILWYTQLPGTLLLVLFGPEGGSRPRLLLVGQALGLALLPLLHTLLHLGGLGGHDLLVQSVVNVALAAAVALRGRSGALRRMLDPVAAPTLLAVSIVVLAAVAGVALRELMLFRPGHLVVSSSQEVDAGYLIGMVNGLREHGTLVDMNSGGGPTSYHYFVYLVMAIISGTSGASALTVYQAVFPLYLFLALALGTYWTTRRLGGGRRAAVLGALLILFLNDFSILNNLLAAATRSEALNLFYVTMNVANLHLSPSWLASVVLMMIGIGEIASLRREGAGFARFLPLICIVSAMAGFKVPTWMCLVGGMGLASLLLVGRRPVYLLASIAAGVGGAAVLLFCVGVSSAQSALGEIFIGYPVLRNDAVQNLTGLGDHTFALGSVTPLLAITILALIPVWLLLTYGVRIVWIVGAIRRFGALRREGDFVTLAALLSIAVGCAISLVSAPSSMAMLVYYYALFGLLVATPFAAVVLYEKLAAWRGVRRLALAGLIGLQMASGLLYVVKPLLQKKNIAVLGGDWLAAMEFIREKTEPDAVLVSNRLSFSTDPDYREYNERFYFVPAFAERVVAVSSNKYYLATDPEFVRKRRLMDTLLSTSSGAHVSALVDSLGADYIVFDKWKGDTLPGSDPAYLEKIYSNPQIDIYRVRRQSVALPVRADSTTSTER